MPTDTPDDPAAVLRAYFAATLTGDLAAAVDRYFVAEPDYVLIATEPREALPWVGRQTDRAGITRAYGQLLDALELLDAEPGPAVVQGDTVAVHGTLNYRARATGRTARSAWSALATVRDGQIVSYRFVEDSGAVAAAIAP